MKKLVAFVLLGICGFVLTPQAWAESVTRQLPFSTKVTLVVPKTYLFKMELCTDAACTDTAYAETQKIVLRTATLSFKLGAGTVDPTSPAFSEVDFSQQYWLRISRSTATGFMALGPPSKLSVVPYALWSNQVEGVGAGVGTITGVYGGNGLSGSATTGAATLNVGAGSGIEVGADTVSIAAGGVTSAHIQDGAVTSADLADSTVASADILDGAVSSADIANGTVASADIAAGGVTSANIQDGTVTSADIAAGGVTSASILDGTVTSADIADGSLTSADVNTSSIQARVTGTCPAGQHISGVNANGTVSCAADAGSGRLLSQFLANVNGVTNGLAGYYNMYSNYVPSENVRIFVWARCTFDASAAGAVLAFRAAYRTPTGGTSYTGTAYEQAAETAMAHQWVVGTAVDNFALTAGVSYDFGINFVQSSPSGGSGNDFCTLNAQIFSR